MTKYIDRKNQSTYQLIRSGITVTGSELTLVEYVSVNDPNNKQLMLESQWNKLMYQPHHSLECPTCTGTAKDPKRPVKPCPTCFGSGWIDHSGNPLTSCRDTAIALTEINRQFRQLQEVANRSDVQQLLKDAQDEVIAQQEREWRNGPGRGPEGKRYTGD